ncbi:MAG: VIT and vWA domain-containing protein [Planctomycetota bacterium]
MKTLRSARLVVLATCCCVQLSAILRGQDVIPRPLPAPIPVPASNFQISRLDVQAVVRQQSARVRISHVLKNPGSAQIEASFLFPLPDDAVVGSLTLLVDGRELTGQVLNAAEARRIYEATVRRQRDPALLEYAGRRLLRSSVFPIPAGAERTVEFEYVVLPVLRGTLRELRLPLRSVRGAQALGNVDAAPLNVQDVSVTVALHSDGPLTTLYSPSHAEAKIEGGNQLKTVTLQQKAAGVPSDFVLMFSSGGQDGIPSVLSYRRDPTEPGYFMVLAAPADQQTRPIPGGRSVVLVIDRSGSMRGEKFLQAQQGIRRLLESLQAEDHFNLVVYDSDVELFRTELQSATPDNLQAALQWADALKPQGGTNISEALRAALQLTAKGERPAWILFLTDGLPTAGVTDEKQIAQAALDSNTGHARIFSLGVGYDVNSRLLDRLSTAHRGRTTYVLPGEQIDRAVATIEAGISSPLLTDLQARLTDTNGREIEGITRTWPKSPADIYKGEVFVLTGRYRTPGTVQVQLTARRDGAAVVLTGTGDLTEQSSDASLSFVERLWAARRIAELTAHMDQNGENEELLTELLELSKRHGILTRWTSFLADERQRLDATTALPHLRGAVREQAQKVSGAEAIQNRSDLQALFGSGGSALRPFSLPTPDAGSATSGATKSLPGAMPDRARPGGKPATAQQRDSQQDRTPRVAGGRTFFWKDGCWMDVRLDADNRNTATRVQLFSDQYFRLLEKDPDAATCLAEFGQQPVLIQLGDVVYLIEPENTSANNPQ